MNILEFGKFLGDFIDDVENNVCISQQMQMDTQGEGINLNEVQL